MITKNDILSPMEGMKMDAEKVKVLRQRAGMTQKSFSEFFQVPTMTIQNWEQGKRECADYLYNLMEYKLIKEGIIND